MGCVCACPGQRSLPAFGCTDFGCTSPTPPPHPCLTPREGFVGLSVADTIRLCLRLGLKDQAHRLARDFKVRRLGVVGSSGPARQPPCARCRHDPHAPSLQVPDRQLALLSAAVLAAQHDWAALQSMAGRVERKSGLTMEHFVAAARWVERPPPTAG